MALRIGTRASALARWQAEWVAARLRTVGLDVELVPIATPGDDDPGRPIGQIGTQGVFTSRLQQALLDGRIDLAVHSLKDLPTDPIDGLTLGAVPHRAPVSDVLVARDPVPLDDLPAGAVIGTGSVRRRAQLLLARNDLLVHDVRGNVDTRLRKLDDGEFDAVVLAEAGLVRLALAERITQRLPHSIMLPAVGQGALGLELRAGDQATADAIATLDDPASHAAVLAERALLAALHGGCLAPVAAYAHPQPGGLRLIGRVIHPEGHRKLEAESLDPIERPEQLGRRVADELLAQGAADLIAAARG